MLRAGVLVGLAVSVSGVLWLVSGQGDAPQVPAGKDQRPTATGVPPRPATPKGAPGPQGGLPDAPGALSPTMTVPDMGRYGFARFSGHPLADRVMTGFGVPPAMRASDKMQAQAPAQAIAPASRQIDIGSIAWAGRADAKGKTCEIVLTGKLAIDKALRGEVTVLIVQDDAGRHTSAVDYRFSSLPADAELIEVPLRARGMVGSEGSEVAGAVSVERERRSLSFQPARSGVQQQILQDAHWLDARLKRARRSFVLTIEMPLFR